MLVLKRLTKKWAPRYDHKTKHEVKILVRYHVVKYLDAKGECVKRDNYIYIFSPSRKNSQEQNDASPSATSSVKVAIVTDVKCRVCGVPADARFDPCGHVIACVDCATMLKKCFLCKVKDFHLISQIH